mgnify:CR=1 FL=1
MKSIDPLLYYFDNDGVTPNNRLPVLLYKNVLAEITGDFASSLEKIFQQNNWIGNWRDIVLDKDHYHSTTHEVLGISKGSVDLMLGGANGKQFSVSAGDVLIIPAGVAHCSLDNSSDYEVIGGYPEGRSWDMIYCEPEKYKEAKVVIDGLPLPKSDPLFGEEGPLTYLWK